jgi:hypothetical protein
MAAQAAPACFATAVDQANRSVTANRAMGSFLAVLADERAAFAHKMLRHTKDFEAAIPPCVAEYVRSEASQNIEIANTQQLRAGSLNRQSMGMPVRTDAEMQLNKLEETFGNVGSQIETLHRACRTNAPANKPALIAAIQQQDELSEDIFAAAQLLEQDSEAVERWNLDQVAQSATLFLQQRVQYVRRFQQSASTVDYAHRRLMAMAQQPRAPPFRPSAVALQMMDWAFDQVVQQQEQRERVQESIDSSAPAPEKETFRFQQGTTDIKTAPLAVICTNHIPEQGAWPTLYIFGTDCQEAVKQSPRGFLCAVAAASAAGKTGVQMGLSYEVLCGSFQSCLQELMAMDNGTSDRAKLISQAAELSMSFVQTQGTAGSADTKQYPADGLQDFPIWREIGFWTQSLADTINSKLSGFVSALSERRGACCWTAFSKEERCGFVETCHELIFMTLRDIVGRMVRFGVGSAGAKQYIAVVCSTLQLSNAQETASLGAHGAETKDGRSDTWDDGLTALPGTLLQLWAVEHRVSVSDETQQGAEQAVASTVLDNPLIRSAYYLCFGESASLSTGFGSRTNNWREFSLSLTKENGGFGMKIDTNHTGLIYIAKLQPSGAAARSGRIRPNDVLVAVNSISVGQGTQHLSHVAVKQMLATLPGEIQLKIRRWSLDPVPDEPAPPTQKASASVAESTSTPPDGDRAAEPQKTEAPKPLLKYSVTFAKVQGVPLGLFINPSGKVDADGKDTVIVSGMSDGGQALRSEVIGIGDTLLAVGTERAEGYPGILKQLAQAKFPLEITFEKCAVQPSVGMLLALSKLAIQMAPAPATPTPEKQAALQEKRDADSAGELTELDKTSKLDKLATARRKDANEDKEPEPSTSADAQAPVPKPPQFLHNELEAALTRQSRAPSAAAVVSKFTGVSFVADEGGEGTWQAHFRFRGTVMFIGNYESEEAAAKAYDASATQKFGARANQEIKLNFPDASSAAPSRARTKAAPQRQLAKPKALPKKSEDNWAFGDDF